MSAIAFLLDENIPEFLAGELLRLEPSIEVLQIGDASAPQKGTPDSEILLVLMWSVSDLQDLQDWSRYLPY
jgi:hypothetical protein